MRSLGRSTIATCLLLLSAGGVIASMTGCAGSDPHVVEHLDERTGVTISQAPASVLFYRDNSGRAAYARDYATLAPLQVNRMGEHRYYLWIAIWSTVAAMETTRLRDDFDAVTIYSDGEPIALEVTGWTPDAIGTSDHPYVPPAPAALHAYYAVTLDQVRFLSEARDLRLVAGNRPTETYELWDSPQSATNRLQAFLEDVDRY